MNQLPDFPALRREMVHTQLVRRGIADERVLEAMLAIPREEFVPERWRAGAYADEPVPIGYGQTISQPYMVALMAERMELTPGDRVLEVGTGCGYAAAVLGRLAAHVVTLELIPELSAFAAHNLHRTGLDANVLAIAGDGTRGYPELAPYDAIAVAAGAPRIPRPLLDELADGGRLVAPVGSLDDQELIVIRRRGDRFEEQVATTCRFVPLRGGGGWK
ncbi:MAG TPA: protein-L-isoaspartate(D-aspartate) O-methyltransferase [Candidatus Limnocylindrales bacterium]|nr:protein-L-isoaspartate(D-aspartate) O-methyltransferase [Candidatus Limnocylindrales bacterium]